MLKHRFVEASEKVICFNDKRSKTNLGKQFGILNILLKKKQKTMLCKTCCEELFHLTILNLICIFLLTLEFKKKLVLIHPWIIFLKISSVKYKKPIYKYNTLIIQIGVSFASFFFFHTE